MAITNEQDELIHAMKIALSGRLDEFTRDIFAILSPEPTANEVGQELEKDRLANPHGDYYRPKARDRGLIIAQLRYVYADYMMAARLQKKKNENKWNE